MYSCVHLTLLIDLIWIFLALGSWMLNFCGSNFNNLEYSPPPLGGCCFAATIISGVGLHPGAGHPRPRPHRCSSDKGWGRGEATSGVWSVGCSGAARHISIEPMIGPLNRSTHLPNPRGAQSNGEQHHSDSVTDSFFPFQVVHNG